MNTKIQSRHSPRSRRYTRQSRPKRRSFLSWVLGVAGALLMIVGVGLILNQMPLFLQNWQGNVTDARVLTVDDLLPLAAPVKPIEGWHDMANMPDPDQAGQALPADQPQPNVEVPVTDYDFGPIPSGPGNVSQMFYIQNTGAEPLEISSVVTSCGCTRAMLSSSVIPPGQRADLQAIFDPDFHDTTGPIKRVIWLETNDPDQPVVELSFIANVRKG